MKIYQLILISFQFYMILNMLSMNIIKKYIKKRIPSDNDTFLFISLMTKFRFYIFYGVFMLPFVKKICDKFIYERNKDLLERNIEILNIKNIFNSALNLSEDEDTEKIKELKIKVRNYELTNKIKRLKRKSKFKKLWI